MCIIKVTKNWQFVSQFDSQRLKKSNDQDWGFLRPPEIFQALDAFEAAFLLRMDNIWFSKVLMLVHVSVLPKAIMALQNTT